MCESYDKMFDALDQLPTDEYLALGSLLSKKMIEDGLSIRELVREERPGRSHR